MEEYQSVLGEFFAMVEREDCHRSRESIIKIKQSISAKLKIHPDYKDFHDQERRWLAEKRAWRIAFKNYVNIEDHPFPGIRPRLIGHFIPPVETIVHSESTDDEGTPQNTSTSQEKGKENEHNIKPQFVLPSFNVPTKSLGTCTCTAANTKLEQSENKRKRTSDDLDGQPSMEQTITEWTKRLKIEHPPQSDGLELLWNRPRYSIPIFTKPKIAMRLLDPKEASEKEFGVKFGLGNYKEEYIYYCEPFNFDTLTHSEAVDLCKRPFIFLKHFISACAGDRKIAKDLRSIDEYLKSRKWFCRRERALGNQMVLEERLKKD